MAQIGQRSLNSPVAPIAVLRGHADYQPLNLVWGAWSAEASPLEDDVDDDSDILPDCHGSLVDLLFDVSPGDRLRKYPEYLAINKFSDPPQLSDLQGIGFGSDDIKALKDCKPGDCAIQMPASTAMDELRKSVNWAAPNVDEEVKPPRPETCFVAGAAVPERGQSYTRGGL